MVTNMITNSSFEVDLDTWEEKDSAVVTRVTSQFFVGVASAQVVVTGSGITSGLLGQAFAFGNNVLRIVPGKRYTLRAWVIGGAFPLKAGLQEIDANDSTVTTTYGPSLVPAAATWRSVTHSVIPQATTVRFATIISTVNAGDSTTFFVDDVSLYLVDYPIPNKARSRRVSW